MSIDEGKNDSRTILPKINWKEEKDMNNKSKKEKETLNKIWTKRLLKFGPQKQAIKRSPTNINLYNNSLRLNKVEITTNEKIENTSIFTPVNSIINETVNNNTRNNIIESEFKKFLKNTNQNVSNKNQKKKLFKDALNLNDIYRFKYKNKNKLNKLSMIKNKLIANSIKDTKLWKKDNHSQRTLLRNNNSTIFSHTSGYMSFVNETLKNNKSMINFKEFSDNIKYRKKNKSKFHDSLNAIEPKILSIPKYKKMKLNEKEIFISKLNIKPINVDKKSKNSNSNHVDYTKKWNLPKSFSFDKLTGRQKEIKNPIKLHCLERLYEYTPKYDSVLCNENKAYIEYNPNLNKDFTHYKKNITRKFIYNHLNIVNNPGNNYNIINLLNERKQEEQKILDKKKLNKIVAEFIYFNQKKL